MPALPPEGEIMTLRYAAGAVAALTLCGAAQAAEYPFPSLHELDLDNAHYANIEIEDLDRDGDPDILMSSGPSNDFSVSMYWLENNGASAWEL